MDLSTNTENRQLLEKAQEIAELFQRAVQLGYKITLEPEQLKILVSICEEVSLHKPSNTGDACPPPP